MRKEKIWPMSERVRAREREIERDRERQRETEREREREILRFPAKYLNNRLSCV